MLSGVNCTANTTASWFCVRFEINCCNSRRWQHGSKATGKSWTFWSSVKFSQRADRMSEWIYQIQRRSQRLTGNVTGRHQGPKQKLWAGHRALSLQCMSHVATWFHCRMWYGMLSLHYACIQSSGIILTSSPRLPLCQISFLSQPPLLS